jgi:signal transduction histidine kinase
VFKSARARLVGWNVVVFSLILALLGAGAYYFFSSRIYTGADQDLKNESRNVQQSLIQEGAAYSYSPWSFLENNPSLVPAPYRVVTTDNLGTVRWTTDCYVRTQPPVPSPPTLCGADNYSPTNAAAVREVFAKGRALPPWTPGGPLQVKFVSDVRSTSFNSLPWRTATFAVVFDGAVVGVVQIAREVAGEEDALKELRLLLIFGGLLGLLGAALGSFFLAYKALVPIRLAFRRQRQFTADASHELRTPLALIRANAEMLARHCEALPSGDPELVGEIIRETDHLNRLVGDLLTLARADAESLQLACKPVDFRALVSEVHEDLSRVAESRGIATSVSLNGTVTVQGDEGRLRQLLLILLDNSLKYTDPGGRVDVSIAHEDNRARLVVSDTGIGIPDKDLPHIFDRFYRVDRAREHESGGTGLGLSIAHWIVQAHHGTIKVESELGKGSRFQVDMPAINASAKKAS